MSRNELIHMSASDIADKIREKQISPVEVVKAYLDRIEAGDAKVNAFITRILFITSNSSKYTVTTHILGYCL